MNRLVAIFPIFILVKVVCIIFNQILNMYLWLQPVGRPRLGLPGSQSRTIKRRDRCPNFYQPPSPEDQSLKRTWFLPFTRTIRELSLLMVYLHFLDLFTRAKSFMISAFSGVCTEVSAPIRKKCSKSERAKSVYSAWIELVIIDLALVILPFTHSFYLFFDYSLYLQFVLREQRLAVHLSCV